MRISDWSSDVCSSDLFGGKARFRKKSYDLQLDVFDGHDDDLTLADFVGSQDYALAVIDPVPGKTSVRNFVGDYSGFELNTLDRSEEHTSELQSLMRISYAVFCLKKKTQTLQYTQK